MSDCQSLWLLVKSFGIAAFIVAYTFTAIRFGVWWQRENERVSRWAQTYFRGRT